MPHVTLRSLPTLCRKSRLCSQLIPYIYIYVGFDGYLFKSKLQVLSFMFVPNFSRCPLPLKLMSFVLNVSKSSTLCPLGQTQL
ncbi:hypothetical protein Hanom_Chr16g01437151 [Helianthus anomalus]